MRNEGRPESELETLLDAIRDAFGCRPALDPKDVATSKSYDPIKEELGEWFGGRHWTEMIGRIGIEFQDSLTLFSPIGFATYLPTYMTDGLDLKWGVTLIVDTTVSCLTRPEKGSEFEQLWIDRVILLTDRERSVVTQFLTFCRSHWEYCGVDEPSIALERWNSVSWADLVLDSSRGKRKNSPQASTKRRKGQKGRGQRAEDWWHG